MDIKRFLNDCESICFDCGTKYPKKSLIKISDGVCLCKLCYKAAKEDYPKEV